MGKRCQRGVTLKQKYTRLDINGATVADGWAGAVMRKSLAIPKYSNIQMLVTDQHGKV